MPQPNVIKVQGTTLFRHSVVGFVDETQNLITVGQLNRAWHDLTKRHEEKTAQACDAIVMLISEIQETGIPLNAEMQRAVMQALTVCGIEPNDVTLKGFVSAEVKVKSII